MEKLATAKPFINDITRSFPVLSVITIVNHNKKLKPKGIRLRKTNCNSREAILTPNAAGTIHYDLPNVGIEEIIINGMPNGIVSLDKDDILFDITTIYTLFDKKYILNSLALDNLRLSQLIKYTINGKGMRCEQCNSTFPESYKDTEIDFPF